MRCVKCGASWDDKTLSTHSHCPYCGELLPQEIPFFQSVEVFKNIAEQFGTETFLEEKQLNGLVSDLLPNAVKEKNIIRTAIAAQVPPLIYNASIHPEKREEFLQEAFATGEKNGLSSEWCSSVLFIFSYPLGFDTRDSYPIHAPKSRLRHAACKKSSSLQPRSLDTYSVEKLIELADQGDADALLELGERYYWGKGITRDYKAAMKFYRRADALGNAQAQYSLGAMYDYANDVAYSAEQAFRYYKKSAEQGYSPAQRALGECLFLGLGCEKDDRQALYWLQKAAGGGMDADLLLMISRIYNESKDTSINSKEKAVDYCKKAIQEGSGCAWNYLGTIYENGCPPDYDRALDCYKKAAEIGVESAYMNVGAYYEKGVAVEKNPAMAVKYYEQGAAVDNMYCLNALGMCCRNGTGVRQDHKRAFDLFMKAAYSGNLAGEYNVGLCYHEGAGVPQDDIEAQKWFLLSAEHGYGKALLALGILEEKGTPLNPPNDEKALYWYLRAAEEGNDPTAQFILGNSRSSGIYGSYIDPLEGFTWFLKAAENGNSTAQNNVGLEYMNGIIVDQDFKKAVYWFEKSIAQLNPYGLFNYGIMLINGTGTSRDLARGFNCLLQSAKHGCVDAQFNVGVCYFEGWGTPRDLDQALVWLATAAQAGYSSAEEYLRKGYRIQNGKWCRKGLLGKVPAPQVLPPAEQVQEPQSGCKDLCKFFREVDGHADRCQCDRLQRQVFCKGKCAYYQSAVDDLFPYIN